MGLWLVLLRRLSSRPNSKLVVLLDEADVFLEQRKISDLQRNALVSGKHNLLQEWGLALHTNSRQYSSECSNTMTVRLALGKESYEFTNNNQEFSY